MVPNPLLAELSQLELLAGVDDAELSVLALLGAHVSFEAGETFIRYGERGESMYLLLEGELRVELPGTAGDPDGVTFIVDKVGTPIGEVLLLAGGTRSATVTASTPARLFEIKNETLGALSERAPHVETQLLEFVRQRLRFSRFQELLQAITGPLEDEFLKTLHDAAQWRTLRSGEYLLERGEVADGWYLIVSGKLAIVRDVAKPGRESFIATVGVGGTVGELSLFTGEPNPASILALRDVEACFLPKESFSALAHKSAQILNHFVSRMIQNLSRVSSRERVSEKLHRIAIGSVTDEPTRELPRKIVEILSTQGEVLYLDTQVLREQLGIPEAALADREHPAWVRLSAWYEANAPRYDFAIFADSAAHPAWTRFCQANADLVVGVAKSHRGYRSIRRPNILEGLENDLGTRRLLVLMHHPRVRLPTGTRAWLSALGNPEILNLSGPSDAELRRLARAITGQAIGVVLSGGNAHAMAHLGALRTLKAAGVPVDIVGGTSFGAVVAGLWAMRLSDDEIQERNKALVNLKPFRSISLSGLGLIKGAPFDWISQHSFGESDIEDLWLGMYCVSVNLTISREVVHDRGSLWRAARASGALPVLVEPHVEDGELYVDGGVINNLPVDVMQKRTAGPIVAVDVFSQEPLRLDRPAGGRRRLIDRVKNIRLPAFTLADILVQSMVISSAQRAARAHDEVDLLVKPDVSGIGSADFEALDRLARAGAEATREGAAALRARLEKANFIL